MGVLQEAWRAGGVNIERYYHIKIR
jgi:hypothetical protein